MVPNRSTHHICVLQLQLKISSEGKDVLYKSESISGMRIKISKLTTKEKYKVEKVNDAKLKIEKANSKGKHINIINVYVPTSERAKKFPGEIQKMYNNLNKLCKEIDKISTSITIIAGYLDHKTALASGQEEEEMKADPN